MALELTTSIRYYMMEKMYSHKVIQEVEDAAVSQDDGMMGDCGVDAATLSPSSDFNVSAIGGLEYLRELGRDVELEAWRCHHAAGPRVEKLEYGVSEVGGVDRNLLEHGEHHAFVLSEKRRKEMERPAGERLAEPLPPRAGEHADARDGVAGRGRGPRGQR
jgi:hypothetical protein